MFKRSSEEAPSPIKARQSDGYIFEIAQEAIIVIAAMCFETHLIIKPMPLPPKCPLFSDWPQLVIPCPIVTLLCSFCSRTSTIS